MELTNAVVQGLLLGGLYALFAMGLSIMFGVMRIVNLAHGDLAVAASYLALMLILHTFIPVWLVLIITVPLFALVGYVLQRALIERSLVAGPLATILVTFGLSIVIQNILLESFSADTRTIDTGSFATSSWKINDSISVPYIGVLGLAAAVAVVVAFQMFLRRTATGRIMRAASDDPEIAGTVGANSRHIYGIATGIACGTVALAGLIFAMRSSFDPSIGPVQLIFAFEAVVIGGLGSLWGTLAGGLALGLAQSVVAQYDASSALLAGHLLFLAVLAFRPHGLVSVRAA